MTPRILIADPNARVRAFARSILEAEGYEVFTTGRGHSSRQAAMDVALGAEVKKPALFHHDPGRSDAGVEAIVEETRAEAKHRGGDIEITAAREGEVIDV